MRKNKVVTYRKRAGGSHESPQNRVGTYCCNNSAIPTQWLWRKTWKEQRSSGSAITFNVACEWGHGPGRCQTRDVTTGHGRRNPLHRCCHGSGKEACSASVSAATLSRGAEFRYRVRKCARTGGRSTCSDNLTSLVDIHAGGVPFWDHHCADSRDEQLSSLAFLATGVAFWRFCSGECTICIAKPATEGENIKTWIDLADGCCNQAACACTGDGQQTNRVVTRGRHMQVMRVLICMHKRGYVHPSSFKFSFSFIQLHSHSCLTYMFWTC